MRISKKILAIALSILMAVSMMPFTVFADDVPEGATYSITNTAGVTTYKFTDFPASLSDQGTYKLYTDVNATSRMAPSSALDNITLDLNGHNFISTAEDYIFLFGGKVLGSKTFKIINTSSQTSYITGDANIGIGFDKSNVNFTLGENVVLNTNKTGIVLGNGKSSTSCQGTTVTIDGTVNAASEYGLTVNGKTQDADPAPAVIVNGEVNGSTAGIYAAGNADYTINGTVTGATGIYQKGGNLTVNDGAGVTGTGADAAYVQMSDGMSSTGDAIVVEDNGSYKLGTTVINGGTITSTAAGTNAIAEYDATTAASTAAEQDITVSGGTFEAAGAAQVLPASYLAEGATENTTTGVVSQTYFAKIDSTYYETINDAIAAASEGDIITVLNDVVVTSPIVVPAGKDVKLDVNGYSISGNIADADGKKLIQVNGKLEFVGSNGGCIYNTNVAGQGHAACQALTGGTVIVNAPVTFGDSDEIRDNANAVNRGCGIQNNGGTLIINDGYFTAIDANYTTGAWAYAILNCEGDTIVNNATVYGNYLHGALGCEEGTLTVNDGSFTVSGANNYYSLYCDGGSITVNGGTFTDNSKYGVNYVGANSSTTITGGDFTYSATTPFVQSSSKSNPVVSGGTYSAEVPAACCAPGFVPVTEPNSQGKYEVEANTADGQSITVEDKIHLNMYINVAAHLESGDAIEDATVVISYSDPSNQSGDTKTVEYSYADFVLAGASAGQYANDYKFTYLAAPAQIADEVTATIYCNDSYRDTVTTSIKDYCDAVKTSSNTKLANLAKAILDYGKSANDVFSYCSKSSFDGYYNTADVTSALNAAAKKECSNTSVFLGYSYIATAVPALRIYVDTATAESEEWARINGTEVKPKSEVDLEGNPTGYSCIDITGILAENLDAEYTVTLGEATLKINALQYAAAINGANDNATNFARSIYNYNKAAEAYFG